MTTSAGRLDPDELAGLEEQRDFLLRSLDDLEREHDAGDLDDHDYQQLKDDYTGRAAETLRAIEERRLAFADLRGSRTRRRTLTTFAAVILFAVVAGLLVANSMGARQPGETSSGGIDTQQSASQRAQGCTEQIQADRAGAIACFKAVLDDDPRNVVALTWMAWTLELTSAALPEGQAADLQGASSGFIERAVAADPDYSYARAFRAVIAFRHGRYAEAKRYLADFRAGDPSAEAEQVIDQFDLDGRIDEALAGGTGAPTTTAPG
ncbi:MAG: hypothetical protein JWM47_2824 [Acidimicrobiales bacterium]|nr:hypothetical protein [Acidimicrobiales bacterium]